MAYAHSANRQGQRQELTAHLRAVGELAAGLAAKLGAAEAMRLIGLWHDLGKFHSDFQRYLLESEAGISVRRHGPDHKAAGASLAAHQVGALALLIQGHHGGLRSPGEFKAWLAEHTGPAVAEALRLAQRAIPDLVPGTRPAIPSQADRSPLARELFLRLLFSTLVDADYLDTEGHTNPEAAVQRGSGATLAGLWAAFERAQAGLTGQRQDAVGQARHAIYQACLAAAEQPGGLFRLTVPTGGGKTRSAMAFALRHALRHGQERIIVAIPFISITEQTADVYRSIFGSEQAVLEHHSAAIRDETGGEDGDAVADWSRLAAENWDAPIIVTTTVQLFESLFSNRPGKMRKLHRLANSIIILDEAQSLPPKHLAPIVDALCQLTHYNTTVVISTATQPAFEAIGAWQATGAREIVPDPARYFQTLKRVRYEWRLEPALDWPAAAEMMRAEPQALAVVNTKKDALALLDALADPKAFHLSTLLCGAHRRQVIEEVKRRLAAGEPCHLVSTQVIEAGVDLDFPLVLRALGPLDSIIQAAGRCNREGRLAEGRVIVFRSAEGHLPQGAYSTGTGFTRELLGEGDLDLHSPEAPWRYFARLFQTVATDGRQIQELRRSLDYPEVARRFRLIEEDTAGVIVPYGSADKWRPALDSLRARSGNGRRILRALQPFVVNVRRHALDRYVQAGLIEPVAPGLGEWRGRYDPIRGLTGDDLDPANLIV